MIADLINLLEAQSFTCGSNIHVEQAPDSATLPYIVLVLENTDYNKTLDTTGGLIFSDLRIECVGKTISQAETLANEVETFIGDYSGTMGSRTCLAVLLDEPGNRY